MTTLTRKTGPQLALILATLGLWGCGSTQTDAPQPLYTTAPSARWVNTVAATAGADIGHNFFYASAIDAAGNSYAVGKVYYGGTYDFGNGVTAVGAFAGGFNALVVKYDATGKALWARTITSGANHTSFNSVVVDGSGNAYVVGGMTGSEPFGFGNGVTAQGVLPAGSNPVLVKYASDGTPLWARSVGGTNGGSFSGVAVDGAGNAYLVGTVKGGAACDFGNGVTVTGPFATGSNAFLAKYDVAGSALWVKTLAAASDASEYLGVAVGGQDRVYVVGDYYGAGSFTIGTITISGGFATGWNSLVASFDASGEPLWARSIVAATDGNWLKQVAVDGAGNVYAAGVIKLNNGYDFGNGATVAGSNPAHNNAVLVKYDAAGNAQWARSTTAGSGISAFASIALDGAGGIYLAGYVMGQDTFRFGDTVTVPGFLVGKASPLLIKYDDAGVPQWAKGATANSEGGVFYSARVAGATGIYVAGTVTGTGSVDFGDAVTVIGTQPIGPNVFLLQYR